jgi:hypothetical protein
MSTFGTLVQEDWFQGERILEGSLQRVRNGRAKKDQLLCALAELQILQFHWKKALNTLSSVEDQVMYDGPGRVSDRSAVQETLVVFKLMSRAATV